MLDKFDPEKLYHVSQNNDLQKLTKQEWDLSELSNNTYSDQ